MPEDVQKNTADSIFTIIPKSKRKIIHSRTLHLSKNYKKHYDEFYREARPAAENSFEDNDAIVVFIIVIALIGIFAAVLQ